MPPLRVGHGLDDPHYFRRGFFQHWRRWSSWFLFRRFWRKTFCSWMISRAVTIIWLCPVSVLCLLLFFVRTLSSLHPMVDLPLFTSAMFFRSRNYGECSPRASFRGCFLRVEVTRKKSHQTIGQCLLVLASIEDLWETTTYFYFSSPFDSESVAERNCFCRERKAGSAQSLR